MDEYKRKIHRQKKICNTIYFKARKGRLKNYRKIFNCMGIYYNLFSAVERVVRESAHLLLIDDGSIAKPNIYRLADDRGIPIFLVDPAKKTYEVINDSEHRASLLGKASHRLNTQLSIVQYRIRQIDETMHSLQMLALLGNPESEPVRGQLKACRKVQKKLKKEARVINPLMEFKDIGLTALYWKAKEAATPEEAAVLLSRFKNRFNTKSAARSGFVIKGAIFSE